jgi:hypothetical protein
MLQFDLAFKYGQPPLAARAVAPRRHATEFSRAWRITLAGAPAASVVVSRKRGP